MIKKVIELCKDLTVMYVEDDALVREQTSLFLSKLFKRVICCEDGEQGLIKFINYEEDIDIVISDISMPKMNGLEMVELIKERKPDQRIILISAHNDEDKFLKSIEIGIDQFLIKPVATEQFIEKLAKVAKIVLDEKEKVLLASSIDSVTGMFNRTKLYHDLDVPSNRVLGLVSLNNFYEINEMYGFDNAERVLVQFSQELLKKSKATTIYRYSLNQFVMLFDSEECEQNLVGKMVECVDQLEMEPIIVETLPFPIFYKCTFGLTVSKQPIPASELLKQAEIASEFAKNERKKAIIYNSMLNLDDQIEHNNFWTENIRKAIEGNRIIIFYQPIFDNRKKKISKYECLVRLQDEQGTIHAPYFFLETAKRIEKLTDITKIVIEESFRKFSGKDLDFSINLTAENLACEDLRNFLRLQLVLFPSIAKHVIFEVLESERLEDYEKVNAFLKELKKMGARIAIDDFGSGYSNFAYLINLDVDFVKIDGTLVKNVYTDQNVQAVIKSIVDFSTKIGIQTIAEYVDCDKAYHKLVELGVDYSQGYMFGEPRLELISE